jgi:hypothetical protein
MATAIITPANAGIASKPGTPAALPVLLWPAIEVFDVGAGVFDGFVVGE